jgi:uroporphyrinogen-III synthase
MKTLYLGLDPSRFPYSGTLFHYPVIRTERIEGADFFTAQELWPDVTHVIFTSQTAVSYWDLDLRGKTAIAIGEPTRDALLIRHPQPLLAPKATQEGVIELLQTLDLQTAFLFLPHSSRARKKLTDFLQMSRLHFFSLNLYDTLFQKVEPVPNLDDFDEIVFTSPSTVEGFLRIYGQLPVGKQLTPIGPITAQALLYPT